MTKQCPLCGEKTEFLKKKERDICFRCAINIWKKVNKLVDTSTSGTIYYNWNLK
jgi:hypothetical protein